MDYFCKTMKQSKRHIYSIIKRLSNKPKPSKGGDLFLFLFFLCIATVFWLISSLNNEFNEQHIDVPIEIVEIPDSITILENVPSNINVTIAGKGFSIISYLLGHIPHLKIKFSDFIHKNTPYESFLLHKNDIEKLLYNYFGGGIKILSINPDTVKFNFASTPGEKCTLKINTDIKPHFQYTISGDIISDIDSVSIYKINSGDTVISTINTELIKLSELKDTTIITAQIKPIPGFKIIPNKVKLLIPVEPLISKKQVISIIPINVPHNLDLILFPSSVEISYLLPMSKYNTTNNILITADYEYTKTNCSNKIPLNISNIPYNFKNIELISDSVEYIIEQK